MKYFLQFFKKSYSKQKKWFILPCEDKKSPTVRYYYHGSTLIINPSDALNRAVYVLNESVEELKRDLKK